MKKRIIISKEELDKLYWEKKLKPREIANLIGYKNERNVRRKMEKYGIPRRNLSEALTKKFKAPFTGNLAEKAYLLGLRAGDFNVRKTRFTFRIQTSTTHPAQVELLRKSFEKYGEIRQYFYKYKDRQAEWFIYVDLHYSFNFLLHKPRSIPQWVLKNKEYFFSFFAAYVDCEGCWRIAKSHEKWTRSVFMIQSQDIGILRNMRKKLEEMHFSPLLILSQEKGVDRGLGKMNKDLYRLTLNRKNDVLTLIHTLQRYAKHPEKISSMQFIFENHYKRYEETSQGWASLRNKIKNERLNK
jgi:hypothetical protein